MVAKINTEIIFSLLPVNAVFIGLTMYNIKHVRIRRNILIFKRNSVLSTFSCLFLFSFQSTINMVMIVFAMVNIFSWLYWPFMFCYSANSVTNRMATVGDIAFDLNWFDYPPEFGKFIVLIIARFQKSMHFTGLNLFPCTLQVFGDVRNWINLWLHSVWIRKVCNFIFFADIESSIEILRRF